MPKQAPLPAKLTRPRANELLLRERIFRLLDARQGPRWTWITAPAGAGKTSLATSWIESKRWKCLWYQIDAGDADPATLFHYLILQGSHLAGRKSVRLAPLTPEFLPGIDLYARRFFELLFGLLAESFVMVLDNLHEVPADAPVIAVVLGALIESLPAHGTLLCLSRRSAPPSLLRWTTAPGFQQLQSEDLCLTEDEAIAYAKLLGPVSDSLVTECNRWVRGWITGLALLMRTAPEELHRMASMSHLAVQELFDYYAQEVFEQVAPALREFLMLAAVLTELDPQTVVVLTGREDAGLVLAKLFEDRLFIERRLLPNGASYQFHPLFRTFLNARLAQWLSAAEIAALTTRATLSLEKRGLFESATLLALACDEPEVRVRLVLTQAPQMVARGRFATLENWLRAIPEPTRESNGWLLYWLGISTSLRDLALGRSTLERAYACFQQSGDGPASWLAVASIIQNHIMAWGSTPDELIWQWVEVFEGMRLRNGGSIPTQIEIQVFNLLCHFSSHCPEHALSRHLVDRALILIRQLSEFESRMATGGLAVGYLTWRGDEAGALALIEQLGPAQSGKSLTTISALMLEHWRCVLLWTRSEHERAYAILLEARARYRRDGLGFFDYLFAAQHVLAALSAGDWATAEQVMQEFLNALQPFQVEMLRAAHALQALQLALGGQTGAGAAAARKVMAIGTLVMSPSTNAMEYTFLALALLEEGALNEAEQCVVQAIEGASQLPSDRWLFDAHLLFAAILFERGEEPAVLDHLRQALALGAVRDFRGGVSLFQSRRAARLLSIAFRHGIEPQYVKRLIRYRKLTAPDEANAGALWPVKLRIRTLGQFALWIDEQPLADAQHATRRPLEVLKALVGFGPTNVRLSTLGAAIWPELDGAAAQNACHVAIHRLRKILGDESAIVITQGVAALNGADAWIDVEVFRRLAIHIRMALTSRPSRPELDKLADQLLLAYPGHFLPEEERSWAIGIREQLRARFEHLALDLSALIERLGATEAAIALNRRCIELDPLTESFHRGLIQGLISLGRKAEALEAFKRCRIALMAGLRVEPSQETYALYARIRQP